MREIKFRAWLEKDKKMVKVYSVSFDNWVIIHEMSNPKEPVGRDQRKASIIEPGYLMQSTGLKDKNGKEIYEGDRIKITDENGNVDQGPVWYVPKRACYCIVWHEGESSYSLADNEDQIEVIGNIYENPDV